VSRPADAGRQRPAPQPGHKGTAEDPANRLVPNIRVSKSMKPFVNRMRLQIQDIDWADPGAADRLDQVRQDMGSILNKKKISATKANKIIAETLDAAANHRLENLRRDQNLKNLARADSNLDRLIEHVESLARSLAKLERSTKNELNKIMAGLNWRQFDTEVFAEFMHRGLPPTLVLRSLTRVAAPTIGR
jgi:DNA repair ATPase RecN